MDCCAVATCNRLKPSQGHSTCNISGQAQAVTLRFVTLSQAAAAGAREGGEQAAASPNKALPFIRQVADGSADGLHKPVGLVLASAYVLSTACSLSGAPLLPPWCG